MRQCQAGTNHAPREHAPDDVVDTQGLQHTPGLTRAGQFILKWPEVGIMKVHEGGRKPCQVVYRN